MRVRTAIDETNPIEDDEDEGDLQAVLDNAFPLCCILEEQQKTDVALDESRQSAADE